MNVSEHATMDRNDSATRHQTGAPQRPTTRPPHPRHRDRRAPAPLGAPRDSARGGPPRDQRRTRSTSFRRSDRRGPALFLREFAQTSGGSPRRGHTGPFRRHPSCAEPSVPISWRVCQKFSRFRARASNFIQQTALGAPEISGYLSETSVTTISSPLLLTREHRDLLIIITIRGCAALRRWP